MLKRLFYLLLLVSCVISLSKTYAQEQESKTGGLARLMSMGQNPFVADPNDIKSNPAYAGYYGNLLWGDIGSQNTAWGSDGKSQFFGVNMNVTNVFTLGVMLTKSDQINGVSISSVDPYMFPLDVHFMQIIPNNNVEVLGSFNTDLMTLGFGVSYLTSQNKEDFALQASKNFEKNFTQIGFNAGVLFNLANQNKLDVSLAVIFPKLSMDTSIVTDKATQTYIKLSAKAFLNLNKEFQLVPIATFISGSGSEDYKDTISSSTNDLPTHTEIMAGVGIHYRHGDFLFAGGPTFDLASVSTAAIGSAYPALKNSVTSLMWNFGAEWYCNSWLTARLGYKTFTGSTLIQTAVSGTKYNETTQTTYGTDDGFTLGVGFKIAGIALDATVNADVLRQGLNNIGGGHGTFAFVSASYCF